MNKISKLIFPVILIIIIILIPLGINAAENSTSNESSVSEQSAEEIQEQQVVEEQAENTSSDETTLEENSVEKETPKEISNLKIEISYPEKITRGEEILLTAIITNTYEDSKKAILTEWILPRGFEIIEGNQKENIQEILSKESYTLEIKIKTSISSELGTNEIKITLK